MDEQTSLPETKPSAGNTALEDDVLVQLITAMRKLEPSTRKKILQVLATHFEIDLVAAPQTKTITSSTGSALLPTFSEDRTISPKEFMLEKKPVSDIERIACLAYYLTHYRDTPHFKTLDLSKLNTEAAQIKLSNAAFAVSNAMKAGLLVPTTRGNKQISAVGELFVQSLPDRAAAKAAMAEARPRRRSKKTATNTTKEN